MLPAAARLRRSDDFRLVIRRGRRSGRSRLVVHALAGHQPGAACAQVGFVVSKAVGNSVVRHRVIRRLRHMMADRLSALPTDSAVVVRALPPAAVAGNAELGADLDGALRRQGLDRVAEVVR